MSHSLQRLLIRIGLRRFADDRQPGADVRGNLQSAGLADLAERVAKLRPRLSFADGIQHHLGRRLRSQFDAEHFGIGHCYAPASGRDATLHPSVAECNTYFRLTVMLLSATIT